MCLGYFVSILGNNIILVYSLKKIKLKYSEKVRHR